jgi:hypothetical protein
MWHSFGTWSLASALAALALSRSAGAEEVGLSLHGVEEAGRNYIGQSGFSPHLVSLFVTGRNPHAAADSPQDHVRWVNDPLHSYVADGTGGLVIWAHPSPNDAERILALDGLAGIEISHAGGSVFRDGLWDRLLTACAEADREFLWGYAADDTHSLTKIGLSWLAMRLARVDESSVKAALRAGAFYTSNGPAITDIAVEGTTIRLRTPTPAEVRWLKSGQFGAGPAEPGPGTGENHCLKVERGVTESHYALNGADGTTDPRAGRFVRALVLASEGKMAHTVPFRILPGGALANPYPATGEWVRSMTHNHADVPPSADPAVFEPYFRAYREKGIPAAFETGYCYWEMAFADTYPKGRLPRVTWVEPDRAPEDASAAFLVHGENLGAGARVQLGVNPASRVEWVDSQTLRVTPPTLPPGRYDVVVDTAEGFRANLAGGYAVQAANAHNAGWQSFTPFNGGPPTLHTYHVSPAPGGVWVGTPSGACRWDGQQWSVVPAGPNSLPVGGVLDIATGPDGSTWFATMRGMARLDPAGRWGSWRVPVAPGERFDSADRYGKIGFTPDGSVWVANRWNAGLVRFRAGVWERYTDKSGLPSNAVRTLAADQQGRLWLGAGNGLFRWEDGKVAERVVPPDLPGDTVTALACAADGSRWIAAGGEDPRRGGVVKLGPAPARVYTPADSGLPSARVWDILVDRQGYVWFATTDGVARLSPAGDWKTLTPLNSGLANPVVYSLAEAADGALWFATAGGVSRWTPEAGTAAP